MIKTDQINHLLGIKESYQASDALTKILFDKDKRENLFKAFLDKDCNLDKDWFHVYFEEEHANKLKYAQDFTPASIALLLSKIIGNRPGMRMDVASGTGSLVIKKWHEDRLSHSPFDYKPSMYFYHCEELSDRAMPFLLFNLMIRGMNAIVIHGDALTREAKQVYFVQNDNDDFMEFSNLNIMPHSMIVEQELDIRKWVEPEIDHIESSFDILNRLGVDVSESRR
ncbi:N-6 DNA methylase [Enterococcus sp. SMC-9]|uniref:N-6 DNA methylase n=1 Tax=Enterococcus sp. SMC-9 TaxID=2862343 RepID=UPI001E3BE0F3|nr:N-6 DNA methylase [Enterococcus sp. SMC-9]MCD1025807.1 N-6 DNA methylase [Enterococcus sp. SMC-9]